MKNLFVLFVLLCSYSEVLACYDNTQGSTDALAQCLKLANQEDARAQYQLGNMYQYGDGVRVDMQSAEAWYLKSAEHGYADAQYALGSLYNIAPETALSNIPNFNSSPDISGPGVLTAQSNLGTDFELCLQIGDGPIEAIKWYRLAAAQGHTDAQLKLGEIYQQGRGVPPDDMLAYMWFDIAAKHGREESLAYRRTIAARINPELIPEAEALSEAWLLEFR